MTKKAANTFPSTFPRVVVRKIRQGSMLTIAPITLLLRAKFPLAPKGPPAIQTLQLSY